MKKYFYLAFVCLASVQLSRLVTKKLRALYERLEVLDKQLEQVRSGDAETFAYLDAKMQVYIAEQLLLDYYSIFTVALGFPCAVPQEETKYMTCETYGKG